MLLLMLPTTDDKNWDAFLRAYFIGKEYIFATVYTASLWLIVRKLCAYRADLVAFLRDDFDNGDTYKTSISCSPARSFESGRALRRVCRGDLVEEKGAKDVTGWKERRKAETKKRIERK